jgi:hypothetical protein
MKRKLNITLEFEAAPVYDESGNEIPTTDEEYVCDILHIINSDIGEEITSVTLDGVEFCHANKSK